MFCKQCGNVIEPNKNFCGRCGSRIEPAATGYTTPTTGYYAPNVGSAPSSAGYGSPVGGYIAQAAEQTVLVMATQQKLSLITAIECNVVFMQDRAVLAYLSKELKNRLSAQVSKDVKDKGLGFFKGSAAMMHYWAEYNKRYYSMNTAAILAEDPSNRVIYYEALSELYYRCYSETYGDEDSSGTTTEGKLQFKLFSGEVVKLIHSVRENKGIKETLYGLFGNKLTYKR